MPKYSLGYQTPWTIECDEELAQKYNCFMDAWRRAELNHREKFPTEAPPTALILDVDSELQQANSQIQVDFINNALAAGLPENIPPSFNAYLYKV